MSVAVPSFTVDPLGPFDLTHSASFYERFRPAGQMRSRSSGAEAGASDGHHLDLAFMSDDGRAGGACVHQGPNDRVTIEPLGDADPCTVADQVTRILSLDIDARTYPQVSQRDPVIGRLMAARRGMRQPCFASPYEAAVWAVLSARSQQAQAVAVRDRIIAVLGSSVEVHGQPRAVLPPPEMLAALEPVQGLASRKLEWLRGVGRAGADGLLDAARLRAVPESEALDHLECLGGIGAFSSRLILLRGAGHPDCRPVMRPQQEVVRVAYGLDHTPSDAELDTVSQAWRPFRSWVQVLLRVSIDVPLRLH